MSSYVEKATLGVVRWAIAKISPAMRSMVMDLLIAEQREKIQADITEELKTALREYAMKDLAHELRTEIAPLLIDDAMRKQIGLPMRVEAFHRRVLYEIGRAPDALEKQRISTLLSADWRNLVRQLAALPSDVPEAQKLEDQIAELRFLFDHLKLLEPVFRALAGTRVLFSGQAYYNAWYLSRALRDIGWTADVLNWDMNPASAIYYHGEDISFTGETPLSTCDMLTFYVSAIYAYDIFHFSNAQGICFGFSIQSIVEEHISKSAEIFILKGLGKKIVYSHGGCLDGVSQTAFSKWGKEPVCLSCRWRNQPNVCSDQRNLEWGKFRNSVADYQCLLGGNRVDYNIDARIHERPEFYCLDPAFWNPDITIPDEFVLPLAPDGTVWLYHAVGNRSDRTSDDGVNIKSSHIYQPLVSRLKGQGLALELLEPTGMPNKDVRYLQAQSDIVLEMLTYGWFGANAREAMMLAKPVICYIRPEWLESVRQEIPEYAEELPIVNATPETVEAILRDLISDPAKRLAIGEKSRAFAIKWHSADVAGRRFDEVYRRLLAGDPLLRPTPALESRNG